MEPLGVTLCVIDTAPHSGGDAYTVASLADHILIPVQPSAPDLRAIHQTIQIAQSAGRPASVVINRALVNHPTIAESRASDIGPDTDLDFPADGGASPDHGGGVDE